MVKSAHLTKEYEGLVYTEKICIAQPEDNKHNVAIPTGQLCVTKFPFVHTSDYRLKVRGTDVGGIVGLGPG